MTFLLLKERASLSRLFHLLEKKQHKKKIRYWLQKWNMRRVSFQYNCNCLLRTLVCKNGFKIQRYCYVMRKCHIRDFLVHTRLCLKIKNFGQSLNWLPALSDYTIWLCIEFLPFWQRLPLKPGGHKQRYLSTVNPDWQVPPFKQLNSSQAFLNEKQRT